MVKGIMCLCIIAKCSKYKDFFRNGYNEHHIYQNKTGLFECNIDGELVEFYPSIGNICNMSIMRNKLHDK